MMPDEPLQLLPLASAVICQSCDWVSNATGEDCPKCHSRGSLMSLARVLNRPSGGGEYGPN